MPEHNPAIDEATADAIDANLADAQANDGALGTMRSVAVALDAATFSDLHDNPVELAPAPGAGKGYQVLGFTFTYHFVTTPYTSANGRLIVGPLAAVLADYSPWESVQGATPDDLPFGKANVESASGGSFCEVRQTSQTNITPPELIDNQPLVIGNPNDDYVGGDGTVTATVRYAVVSL